MNENWLGAGIFSMLVWDNLAASTLGNVELTASIFFHLHSNHLSITASVYETKGRQILYLQMGSILETSFQKK